MILIIDNYDSFTYNLVQYLGEINPDLLVVRNDRMDVGAALGLNPSHIVISPGPCTPKEAGISVELIRQAPSQLPILGVCLGHQSIGEAFGGTVLRAPEPMHGKTSLITTNQAGIFAGLPPTFIATRYHSLIVARENLPAELEVTAHSPDGLIMGLRHKVRPVHGVQFHPESILTEGGKNLLANFLGMKGT